MVNNLTFEKQGYGHYKISGLINDLNVSFVTSEMSLADAAQDEEDPKHEEALEIIERKLNEAFDNYYNQH